QVPGFTVPTPTGAFYAFPDVSDVLGRTIRGKQITTSTDLATVILEEAEVGGDLRLLHVHGSGHRDPRGGGGRRRARRGLRRPGAPALLLRPGRRRHHRGHRPGDRSAVRVSPRA